MDWKRDLEAYLNSLTSDCKEFTLFGGALGNSFGEVLQNINDDLAGAILAGEVSTVAEIWQKACLIHQCEVATKKIASGEKWYGELSMLLMLEDPFTAPVAQMLALFLEKTARAQQIKVPELISLMMRITKWHYGPYDILDLITDTLNARPNLTGSRAARRLISFKLDRLWATFERTCAMQANKLLYYESFMTVQIAARDILHEMPNPTADSILTALQATPYALRKMPFHRFENGAFIKLNKVKKLCGIILSTTLEEMQNLCK
jgi:hypothetical protein